MKILCSGDIHIGRRPTRLPPEAGAGGPSAARAWLDTVRLARDLAVDLVLLSGDVVDRENRYFEAFGPLEGGIRDLAEAGIPVVAVAGNHDFDVLPRLAESFSPDQFRLLGRGGQWERVSVTAGGQAVWVEGWSFPASCYPESPLARYDLPPPAGGIVIGMVHGDLGQAHSPYAPLEAGALERLPAAFWLLGHVHSPAYLHEPGRVGILYPGSPLALSPKEPGRHGPWLVELSGGGRFEARQVARSPVRYEELEVDLEGVRAWDAVEQRLAEAVRALLAAITAREGGALEYLVCRVRFTGRTPLHRWLEAHLSRTLHDLKICHGRATAVVDDFSVETRPEWDLAGLARGTGPPALLARLVLALQGQGDDGEGKRLLQLGREALESLAGSASFRLLGRDELLGGLAGSDAQLARELAQQGLLLLDELLAQKLADTAPPPAVAGERGA